MSKRGQFYLFDAFFAAVILIVGIGFLVSGHTFVPQQSATQTLVSDASLQLTTVSIEEFFTDWVNENRNLMNLEYTSAQQAHVWWYNTSCSYCEQAAVNLTQSVLGAIGEQSGVLVILRNSTHSLTLFNQTPSQQASFLIVNEQIIISEDDQGNLLGPDILEVRAWR